MDVKRKAILPQDMGAYVEQRLDQWARWYAQGNGFGLGYPPCSIEYRLLHEGIVKTNQRGRKPLEVNEAAEEIEQLITVLWSGIPYRFQWNTQSRNWRNKIQSWPCRCAVIISRSVHSGNKPKR